MCHGTPNGLVVKVIDLGASEWSWTNRYVWEQVFLLSGIMWKMPVQKPEVSFQFYFHTAELLPEDQGRKGLDMK